MSYLGRDGKNPRTYRDLITMGRRSSGTCVSCRSTLYGGNEMFSLGTRANICRKCCEKKGDEVLGPIVRAERKARRYVREAIKRQEDVTKQLSFYAHLTGAPPEFIENVYLAFKKYGGRMSVHPSRSGAISNARHKIQVAYDQSEAGDFVQWLLEQGFEARVGKTSDNYVDGVWTKHNQDAAIYLSLLWKEYKSSPIVEEDI